MTIKFFPNDKGNPAGKLADAELVFSGGPAELEGLRLVGFAIFSVAYTGYWFYVASAFREGLPAWIERLAGNGATLAYRQLEIAGYPFQFRLIFHEPLLDAPAFPALGGKPMRWNGARAMATMAPSAMAATP